jgi:hypothetical protein
MSPSCGKGDSGFQDAVLGLLNDALVAGGVFLGGMYTLDDIVDDVEVASTYAAGTMLWTHTILVTYKPESPLDQAVFGAAAAALVDATAAPMSYCTCSPTFSVIGETRAYEMAEIETSSSSSPKKCKGAFSAPKSSKKRTRRGSAATSEAAVSSGSLGVIVAAALVVVAAVAVLAVRQRRAAVAGASHSLAESPVV